MKKIRSSSMKIGKVLHDELKDILDIYPVIAPQNISGSFGVYRRTSLSVANTKDIYNHEEIAEIEIAIICQTYADSIEKAMNVKMYLEHLHGSYMTAKEESINISDITLTDCSEEWSNDNYIQILKFAIRIDNEPDKY